MKPYKLYSHDKKDDEYLIDFMILKNRADPDPKKYTRMVEKTLYRSKSTKYVRSSDLVPKQTEFVPVLSKSISTPDLSPLKKTSFFPRFHQEIENFSVPQYLIEYPEPSPIFAKNIRKKSLLSERTVQRDSGARILRPFRNQSPDGLQNQSPTFQRKYLHGGLQGKMYWMEDNYSTPTIFQKKKLPHDRDIFYGQKLPRLLPPDSKRIYFKSNYKDSLKQ